MWFPIGSSPLSLKVKEWLFTFSKLINVFGSYFCWIFLQELFAKVQFCIARNGLPPRAYIIKDDASSTLSTGLNELYWQMLFSSLKAAVTFKQQILNSSSLIPSNFVTFAIYLSFDKFKIEYILCRSHFCNEISRWNRQNMAFYNVRMFKTRQ